MTDPTKKQPPPPIPPEPPMPLIPDDKGFRIIKVPITRPHFASGEASAALWRVWAPPCDARENLTPRRTFHGAGSQAGGRPGQPPAILLAGQASPPTCR